MSSNLINGQVVLAPDGFGYSRYKEPTPTPPAGTNQAIYVMRMWMDSYSANFADTVISWPSIFYWGWSFNADHKEIDTTGFDTDFEYNFLGMKASATYNGSHTTRNECGITEATSSGKENYAIPARLLVSGSGSFVTRYGISFYLGDDDRPEFDNTTSPSLSDAGAALYGIPKTPAAGQNITFIWRVYGNSSDTAEFFEGWIYQGAKDLSPGVFDINNTAHLDPDNPSGAFPKTFAQSLITMNGNALSAWRPGGDGNPMAFPTHFMCRMPWADVSRPSIIIDYLGVQYSQITI